jgi:hypothetical protein
LRSDTYPRNTLVILGALCLLASLGTAFADGDLPPPPPAEEIDEACVMLETHALTILSYWWLVSGTLASAIGVLVHWVKTRGIARRWRGDQPTWVQFWILPVVVSTVAYAVICGAFLIYVSRACSVVGQYFESNVGISHVATILLGELLAILPAVIFAFRGQGTVTYAMGER